MWYEEKNMKVFSFVKTDIPRDVVDVMIYHPLDFEECFSRKYTITIGDQQVDIASVADLLQLKRQAGRDKDQNHIAALERILRGLEP